MQLNVKVDTPAAALERVGGKINIRKRYDNFIGGAWVPPAKGQYFENRTPISGEVVCEIARSTAEDIETALDAAHVAAATWTKTAPAERAAILMKIADRMEAHLAEIATVETIDNGKPIRETMAADIPLADRPLPLFRQLHPRAGRLAVGDRRDHDRLSLPRAARRRRADHPVELPHPDGGVEAGASDCRRQLRRLEARRADAHEHHGSDGSRRRPAAARRAQRRQRLRRRGRQAARLRTRASPRSRLPARRRRAASSCSTRRRTSSPSRSSSAASRPTSSLPTCSTRTTPSSTRRSRASPCSPSTRARCAPARRAPLYRSRSTTPSWSARSSA